jgi:hypothetical protein
MATGVDVAARGAPGAAVRLKTLTAALPEHLRRILVDGPHAHGLTYHDLPSHAELRRLWALHGAALRAAHPRRRLWFEDRDFFVTELRRERKGTP